MADHPRILYLITKANFGGAQRYVYDLATTAQHEYSVTVALGQHGTLAEKLEQAGIRTISIPHLQRDIHLIAEIRSFIALWRIIGCERPDIVHLNSAKAAGLGSVIARCRGVPRIVFTAHGWEFNNPQRSALARVCFRLLSWLTVLFSHVTITVSDAMRNDLSNLPLIRNTLRTIHHGITLPTYADRSSARATLATRDGRLQRRQDALWLGMIAELHSVKGIDTAIDALRHVIDAGYAAHLIVCGEGDQRETLEQRIRDANLSPHVSLLGFMSDAAEYVTAFDILLFPSRAEGFGYVLLEAGGAGLPIIASSAGGITELIRDGKTGLVIPPNDSEALARGITQLAEDGERRNELGRALHQRITTDHSLQDMYQATRAVYDQSERAVQQ